MRVGLNSSQVIAGEIGSRSLGYNTIGEQVGMAQRMESVAQPGGVMLSASTARLVEHNAVLSEPERAVRVRSNTPVTLASYTRTLGEETMTTQRSGRTS